MSRLENIFQEVMSRMEKTHTMHARMSNKNSNSK